MFSLVCVIIIIGFGVCMPCPRFLLSGWVRLVSCPFQGGWGHTAGVAIPEGWGGVSIPEGAVPEVVGVGIPMGGRYTRGHVYLPPPSHGTWDIHPLPALATAAHTVGKQAVRILME